MAKIETKKVTIFTHISIMKTPKARGKNRCETNKFSDFNSKFKWNWNSNLTYNNGDVLLNISSLNTEGKVLNLTHQHSLIHKKTCIRLIKENLVAIRRR